MIKNRVDYLLANFDLDDFGVPVVSWRSGLYFIIDGQHRIEAMKQWLGDGWEVQKIECRVYQGLSEKDEAEMFDRLNDQLTVNTFDKFRVRVTAGREMETKIDGIVKSLGLKITRDKVEGRVMAVGTLSRIYARSDGDVLTRALKITHNAYGDAGLEASVIDGLGHVCQRYNGVLDEKAAINRLSAARGGVKGLMNKAFVLHNQTGNALGQCVAAAAIDIINMGQRKKLTSWWKVIGEAAESAEAA